MIENSTLDINSLEGADTLSLSEGTPKEIEENKEFYRTFKRMY